MKRARILRWLIGLTLCLTAFCAGAVAQAGDLEVHFLNVGRNDAILIRCDGECAFIDSGTYKWGVYSADYMRNAGVTSLKYYIGTHAHSDHVGGAPAVLAALPTGTVLEPHQYTETLIKSSAVTAAEKQAVSAVSYQSLLAGQSVTVGGATLNCLGPLTVRKYNYSNVNENANSLVLMLTYGQTRILLTGDATGSSLKAIEAANPGCLRADVYKNPHHNGRTSQELLNAIRPAYTVFSTSDSDMPARDFIQQLSEMSSRVFITTANHSGNVILTSDGHDISVQTQYTPASMALSSSELSLYEGKSASLKATLQPKKRFQALTWSSDNPAVAKVNGSGKVTGVQAGQTVIRATDGSGQSASCRVTVHPASVVFRKSTLTLEQGKRSTISFSIQPSGTKKMAVTWVSLDPSVAAVDEKGRVTGIYPGSTAVTATLSNGQSSSLPVTVQPVAVRSVSIKPSSLKLTLGNLKTLTATVSPKNATWREISWSSADPAIAEIDAQGQVKAAGLGMTTVTATTPEGKTRSIKVTVIPVFVKKIMLSPAPAQLIGSVPGKNQAQMSCTIQPANATIPSVAWSSSNNKVLTIDDQGLITAHATGSAYVTCKATDGSGRSARVRVKVVKNELNRRPSPVSGQLVTQVQTMRYTAKGLEVKMYSANRTGARITVPVGGTLTIVTPSGERIPALRIEPNRYRLNDRATRTDTYYIPLTAQLQNLDLSACDAIILP